MKVATDFDRFWAIYPARLGSNPKHPARLRFTAAVKAGVDPAVIVACAMLYATEQAKLHHLRTVYVAQAVTWLNQRRWEDYVPKAHATPEQTIWICTDDVRWQQAAEAYKNVRGRTPPTVPGLGGHGWHFPTALMVTGDARNANPADEASQRGEQSSIGVVPSNDLDQPNNNCKSAGQRGELSATTDLFGIAVSEPPKDLASI